MMYGTVSETPTFGVHDIIDIWHITTSLLACMRVGHLSGGQISVS